MTRKELIKALRCFASEGNCPVDECNEKCPYWMEDDKFDLYSPHAEISDEYQLCRAVVDMLEQDAPGWISVKDRLPKENGTYLVFAPTYSGGSSSGLDCTNGVMFARWRKHWSIEVGYYRRPNCVTHWMPLPEPPKEETEC